MKNKEIDKGVFDYTKSIESEEDYRKEQGKLSKLLLLRSWRITLLISGILTLSMSFAFFSFFYDLYGFTAKAVALSILAGILFAMFFVMYFRLGIELIENSVRNKIIAYEAENIKNDVDEDIFENSIRMRYKYLDQYYLQTKEQAHKGFFATMLVTGFGALLILGGIVGMFFGYVDPSYVTCAAGVIIEFVSAIFFYLYNKTVSSMGKYHNKLVLSHNLSTALKVAESLPDNQQIAAKNLIVTELLKDINSHMTKQDI